MSSTNAYGLLNLPSLLPPVPNLSIKHMSFASSSDPEQLPSTSIIWILSFSVSATYNIEFEASKVKPDGNLKSPLPVPLPPNSSTKQILSASLMDPEQLPSTSIIWIRLLSVSATYSISFVVCKDNPEGELNSPSPLPLPPNSSTKQTSFASSSDPEQLPSTSIIWILSLSVSEM